MPPLRGFGVHGFRSRGLAPTAKRCRRFAAIRWLLAKSETTHYFTWLKCDHFYYSKMACKGDAHWAFDRASIHR